MDWTRSTPSSADSEHWFSAVQPSVRPEVHVCRTVDFAARDRIDRRIGLRRGGNQDDEQGDEAISRAMMCMLSSPAKHVQRADRRSLGFNLESVDRQAVGCAHAAGGHPTS